MIFLQRKACRSIWVKKLYGQHVVKSLLITVVVNAVGAVLVYVPLLQLLILPVPLKNKVSFTNS